jgi:hypothetical protein
MVLIIKFEGKIEKDLERLSTIKKKPVEEIVKEDIKNMVSHYEKELDSIGLSL